MLADLKFRLNALFRRNRLEDEMNVELREHYDRRFEKFLKSGMSRKEAMRRTRLAVGGPEQIKEAVRDARGVSLFETFLQDLRHAARMLRKNPGFTAAAILTLALGIGANTAMSGVVDALLFRVPAHIVKPEEISDVVLTDKNPQATGSIASYPDYLQLAEHSSLLEIAAQAPRDVDFGSGSELRQVHANYVTDTYFRLLGVSLLAGRSFSAEEDDPRHPAYVVILSYSLWKELFSARQTELNREVTIGGERYIVIGVAPKDFNGTSFSSIDVWLPIATVPYFGGPRMLTDRASKWFSTIGRTRNFSSRAAAEVEATSAFQHSGGESEQTIRLNPHFAQRRDKFSESARVSLWLAGTAFLVLLIACANVANLYLERMMQRRREMAVRLQLGATRTRLVLHSFSEIALLGAFGGIVAVAVVFSAAPLTRAFLLTKDFYAGNYVNWDLLWTALGFTVIVVGCVGSIVAWRAGRTNIMDAIKSGAGVTESRQRSSLRASLLAGQVAITLLLSIGAALLVRSLENVHSYDLGFEADRLILAKIDLDSSAYKTEDKTVIFQRLVQRARQVPGVERAAIATMVPFMNGMFMNASTSPESLPKFNELTALSAVDMDYFATMGMGLREGRTFSPSDTSGSPQVLVVNETLARDFWPGRAAVGNCLLVQLKSKRDECLRVIGVVRDERRSFTQGDQHPRFVGSPGISGPEIYLPIEQVATLSYAPPPGAVFIRASVSISKILPRVSSALQSIAPANRFVTTIPFTDLLDSRTRNWRLGAGVFSFFSLLALVLTSVGIYGVLAYSVRQRTAEIGVRMALGAQPSDVLCSVASQAVKPVCAGLALGIISAIWLSQLVQSLLYQVKPGDLVSYLIAIVALLAVALVACFLPARRAMNVDPIRALRYE